MFNKTYSLSHTVTSAALLISLTVAMLPSSAFAEDTETGFSFSAALQQSLDNFATARDELRSDITAAVEGLSRDERESARADFQADVQALRAEGAALRTEADAELAAAGVDTPDRADGAAGGQAAANDGGQNAAGPGGRGGPGRGARN